MGVEEWTSWSPSGEGPWSDKWRLLTFILGAVGSHCGFQSRGGPLSGLKEEGAGGADEKQGKPGRVWVEMTAQAGPAGDRQTGDRLPRESGWVLVCEVRLVPALAEDWGHGNSGAF